MGLPRDFLRSSSSFAKVPFGDRGILLNRPPPGKGDKTKRHFDNAWVELRFGSGVKNSLFLGHSERSGVVNDDSKLYYPGNTANYWSRSSGSSASNARNLNFDTNVNPSNNGNRYTGRSLRCRFAPFGARSPSLRNLLPAREVLAALG